MGGTAATRSIDWTPRQREVLDLLARGRTNPEIASALGISLDGAKWHVSEVMGRLGVDRREDAADYWVRENRLVIRFGRRFREALSIAAIRWVAAAGALAIVAVAAVALVLLAFGRGGDDQIPAATSTPTEPPASATPSPAPTRTATATPTTMSATISVNGRQVPLAEASVLPPGARTGPLSILVTHGCWACDVPDMTIERVTWDATGGAITETVFDASAYGSYITGIGASDNGSIIVAGVCIQSYCGPMGSEFFADARTRIYRSLDRGASWDELVTVDGYAFPVGVGSDGEAIVVRVPSATESFVASLPSGERFFAPSPTTSGTWPFAVTGGRPYWQLDLPGYPLWNGNFGTDAESARWAPDIPADARMAAIQFWGWSGMLWSWSAPGGTGMFIGDPYEDGPLRVAWSTPFQWFRFAGWVNGSTSLAGNAAIDGRSVPVVLHQGPGPDDLQIQVLAGAMFPTDDRNKVIAAVAGPFARVTNAGDCLNVREAPGTSATIVGCYRDGVLLQDLGETTVTDGMTWVKVVAPTPIEEWAGREGWASADYLAR